MSLSIPHWVFYVIVGLILLAAVVLGIGHAFAMTTAEATQLARDAGFPGDVDVVESESPNGHYVPFLGDIVLFQPAGFPDRWMAVILYHEIAHWQQHVSGIIAEMESVEREWDADVRGMRMGCAHGLTMADFTSLWAWVYERYGNRESPGHGSVIPRAVNTMLRTGAPCGRAETPWMGFVRGFREGLRFALTGNAR